MNIFFSHSVFFQLRPSQPLPSLFTDESFARCAADVKMTTRQENNKIKLKSHIFVSIFVLLCCSQVSWDPPHFAVTGYKAVASDGYGISYNIQVSEREIFFS